MSLRPKGTIAAPGVADLGARSRVARAQPVASVSNDDALPELGAVVSIPDGAKYATSEQLAARFQVSVDWVESNSANLGATPISDSPNSKLRYHLATADAYMDARRRPPPARVRGAGGRKPKPAKRTHTRTGRPLLDVD
jgi:hypothetical protein